VDPFTIGTCLLRGRAGHYCHVGPISIGCGFKPVNRDCPDVPTSNAWNRR